jgi:MFS family permease
LVVVAASFIALLVSPLALVFPVIGLFVGPVTTTFGWDRATFFLGPSIGTLAGAALAPVLGILADRWGIRSVLVTGTVVYALAVSALATITGRLPGFLAISVLVYAAGQTQTTAVYGKAIASWFDRGRGTMLALATCAFGAGGFITPFIAKVMMERFGWRLAYAGLGFLIMAVALPAILLAVREKPVVTPPLYTEQPESPELATRTVGFLTLRDALLTRIYWTLITFFFCVSFALTGVVANLVPMLVGRGLAFESAVFAVSAVALSQLMGRLASGYLLDKVRSPRISLIWFMGSTVGLCTLLTAHSPPTAIFAAVMLGLSWGAEGEMTGYYVSRYFGLHHFARITGTVFTSIALGAAASQMIVARLFDQSKGYQLAIAIMIAAMLLACALLASLGPYIFTSEEGNGQVDEVAVV